MKSGGIICFRAGEGKPVEFKSGDKWDVLSGWEELQRKGTLNNTCTEWVTTKEGVSLDAGAASPANPAVVAAVAEPKAAAPPVNMEAAIEKTRRRMTENGTKCQVDYYEENGCREYAAKRWIGGALLNGTPTNNKLWCRMTSRDGQHLDEKTRCDDFALAWVDAHDDTAQQSIPARYLLPVASIDGEWTFFNGTSWIDEGEIAGLENVDDDIVGIRNVARYISYMEQEGSGQINWHPYINALIDEYHHTLELILDTRPALREKLKTDITKLANRDFDQEIRNAYKEKTGRLPGPDYDVAGKSQTLAASSFVKMLLELTGERGTAQVKEWLALQGEEHRWLKAKLARVQARISDSNDAVRKELESDLSPKIAASQTSPPTGARDRDYTTRLLAARAQIEQALAELGIQDLEGEREKVVQMQIELQSKLARGDLKPDEIQVAAWKTHEKPLYLAGRQKRTEILGLLAGAEASLELAEASDIGCPKCVVQGLEATSLRRDISAIEDYLDIMKTIEESLEVAKECSETEKFSEERRAYAKEVISKAGNLVDVALELALTIKDPAAREAAVKELRGEKVGEKDEPGGRRGEVANLLKKCPTDKSRIYEIARHFEAGNECLKTDGDKKNEALESLGKSLELAKELAEDEKASPEAREFAKRAFEEARALFQRCAGRAFKGGKKKGKEEVGRDDDKPPTTGGKPTKKVADVVEGVDDGAAIANPYRRRPKKE